MDCSSSDITNSNNTLRLFDDSPVFDANTKGHLHTPSNQLPSHLWLNHHQAGAILEELNRANEENRRLKEMLTVVCENYDDLKKQLMDYMSKSANNELLGSEAKKRKVEIKANDNYNINYIINKNNNVESCSSDDEENLCDKPKEEVIKAKISRVAVRTEASDSSLILKDGYQWRKYGQKVTRDNPCPRAYFKCSFAPSCPVKKKVQRSVEDRSMLVATYEGEHNHPPPTQQESTSGSGRCITVGSVHSCGSAGPTITLDLTKKPKPKNATDTSNQFAKLNSTEFQKLLAEQMASTLTKDPNFTAALTAAISGRFLQQNSSD